MNFGRVGGFDGNAGKAIHISEAWSAPAGVVGLRRTARSKARRVFPVIFLDMVPQLGSSVA